MSRVEGVVPGVTKQNLAMCVEVISEPIPENDDRTVIRQPKLDAESEEVDPPESTESLCIRSCDQWGLL